MRSLNSILPSLFPFLPFPLPSSAAPSESLVCGDTTPPCGRNATHPLAAARSPAHALSPDAPNNQLLRSFRRGVCRACCIGTFAWKHPKTTMQRINAASLSVHHHCLLYILPLHKTVRQVRRDASTRTATRLVQNLPGQHHHHLTTGVPQVWITLGVVNEGIDNPHNRSSLDHSSPPHQHCSLSLHLLRRLHCCRTVSGGWWIWVPSRLVCFPPPALPFNIKSS